MFAAFMLSICPSLLKANLLVPGNIERSENNRGCFFLHATISREPALSCCGQRSVVSEFTLPADMNLKEDKILKAVITFIGEKVLGQICTSS